MDNEPQVTGLSRTQFAVSLGICLAIFLLAGGPIWQQPWKMDQVDLAILWSYAAVPLLVLGFLAWSKRLRIGAFLLETLRLVLVKYSVTFALALVLWTVTDQPAHAAPAPLRSNRSGASVALPAYQGPTGTLRGRVMDGGARDGAGGVLVFVDTDLVGAASQVPLELANDGHGLAPHLAAVQAGQPIALRSADGRLHTAAAETTQGASLFNVPAIRSGSWSRTSIDEAHDAVKVRCTVHPGEEPAAYLVVLRHGWHAVTAADGTFAIPGVPRGTRRVVARRLEGESTADAVRTVEVGEAADVELAFSPR
ncbi:MAG: carboxypeptidase-like regulatory domain-containing protein [Polyangiaceae bacterium]